MPPSWRAVIRRSLVHVIARCCRLKADVVGWTSARRAGLRAVLNYGHTFAHAFETLTGYGKLLHGEAVAIGMVCAARLAERLGRVDAEFRGGSGRCSSRSASRCDCRSSPASRSPRR